MHEITRRKSQGIRRFDAVGRTMDDDYPGFMEPEPYASEPLSRYQKWMRREIDADDGVTYHYTQRFGKGVVERSVYLRVSFI
jgi:DNA (cytosine-5)-methyltransferase 1